MMQRIKVYVVGTQSAHYFVDSQTGEVWNREVGGTAWKCQAVPTGSGAWQYGGRNGQDVLILLPVQDPTPLPAPPLGLRPANIAVLEYDKARCKEIGEALLRYAVAMKPIPQDWLDELSELTERNQPVPQVQETLQ